MIASMQAVSEIEFIDTETSSIRVRQYFVDQTAWEFFKRTLAPFIGSAATGAGLGAGVGTIIAGPPGAGSGAFIGFGAGCAIGVLTAGAINYKEYHTWMACYKETQVFQEFEELHHNHPALQEFIDPFILSVALDPVRTPSGHILDRSTLRKLPRDAGTGRVIDPIHNDSFFMEEVEDAPEVLAKLKAVYKMLLERELETITSAGVRGGLQTILVGLERQVKNYIERETARLMGRFKSKKISITEFGFLMGELIQRMDPAGAINYKEYHTWMACYKETQVFQEFEELHHNHPVLQEFIDPFTLSVELDPVRTPCGHIFDRSTLKELSREVGTGRVIDPMRKNSFSMEEVEDAPEMLAKLKAVYKVLLERDLETVTSPEVREGLQAILVGLERQVKSYIERETTRLMGRFKSKEISVAEFGCLMGELTQRMDPQILD
jgi:hypothetical protein